MTRFTVLVLIASLILVPTASATPQEAPSISTVLDSILEPIHSVFAWLAELIGPSPQEANGVPEEAIAIPEGTEQEYGAEIVPNG